METTTIPYHKEYKSPEDLVSLMKSRGLTFDDEEAAAIYLKNIGYYRLSGFLNFFLQEPKDQHKFISASKFESVLQLYRFDKKLRMLIINEIEKIEVALKSTLANLGTVALCNDKFWMSKEANFHTTPIGDKPGYSFKAMKNILKKSKDEEFVRHFIKTYSDELPPAWMMVEIMTLGEVDQLYSNIKVADVKKKIAQHFCLQVDPFESWIGIIHQTRNLCCHHSRLWNKTFAKAPMIPKKNPPSWIASINNKYSIYFNLCVIKHFVDIISPNNDMAQKLRDLLDSFPNVYTGIMGFPQSWKDECIWK